MGKHKQKSKSCTSSVHKKGHFIEVKAKCHIGKGKLMPASACKHVPKSKHVKHHRATEVPASCKGMKHGAKRNECVRNSCAQRPSEYREQCLKRAGLRKT